MSYKYKILHINNQEQWIFIKSNDDFDLEEPDAFLHFVKMIQRDVNGKIVVVGNTQYKIIDDGIGFVYQWDGLFGITVIYPETVTESQAVDYLSKYITEF